MKNILTAFLLIFMLSVAGCQTKEDGVEPVHISGKWQLVRVEGTNMIANQPPSPPMDLPYQEIIEFKADSTFTRSRSNGYEATGSYTIVRNSNNNYEVQVTFTNSDLNYHDFPGFRQFSSSHGKLYLQQIKSDELVEDHRSHDGYNLFYQKVKSNN